MLTKNQIELAIEASQRLTRRLCEASLAHGQLNINDAQRRAVEVLETLAATMEVRLEEMA